jgi:hypothetical protein
MCDDFFTTSLVLMKAAFAALVALISAEAIAAGPGVPGLYIFGHEVETFQPCHSKQVFWVVGSEASLKTLRQQAEKKHLSTGKPYQAIYVELDGRVDTKSKRDGFAASYDGLFRFGKIEVVKFDVPSSCPGS